MATTKTEASERLWQQARKVIPGGLMSNWRKSKLYRPVFIDHGEGANLYDVDGNKYVDFNLSFGPAILGHSNDHIRQAVAFQSNLLYSREAAEIQVRAAEKVVKHVPCADLVRFACSGTEVNLNALRVARAYTGRNMFARFNGHYHGSSDDLLGGIVSDPSNPIASHGKYENDLYSQMANTGGRVKNGLSTCYIIEWNDLNEVEKLFRQHGNDIAALIMEPVMVNNFGCLPEAGYLKGVRELCTEFGVVLIFDEVLTGFRIDLNGAQGHFNVTPDLATFGKAIGGGYPVSAFCGKREIMDVLTNGEAVVAGTYNGQATSMAAVVATIEELEKDNGAAYRHIEKIGNMLKSGLDEIVEKHGIDLLLQGFPGAWSFTFTQRKKIRNHTEGVGPGMMKIPKFMSLMRERGVFIGDTRMCVSVAHTEKDIEFALECAEETMKQLKKEKL